MIEVAALMMVASGAIHATVNAIFKSGQDKLASRALIDISGALFVLPLVFFVPLPHGAWFWLLGSLIVHVIYFLAMVKAFQAADMSAAYPIMRGTAPVFAALGAVVFLGDAVTVPVAIGMGLVTTGIFASVFARHITREALAWSVLVGVSVATYTVLDAGGVRNAPTEFSYIGWAFLTLGGVIGVGFALYRGPSFLTYAKGNWRSCGIAGVLGVFSYGLALLAYAMESVPRLAPLRESSILFALLVAVIFLKEKPDRLKILGGVIVFAGVVTLLIAR